MNRDVEVPRGALMPRSVQQVVGLVLVLGAVSAALLITVAPRLPAPPGAPTDAPRPGVFLVAIALVAAGELISVRVRRGTTSEDLTFLEVVLVGAALTMAPVWALAAVLAGLLLASLVQRRPWVKTLFNIGSYATSTAAMLLIYYLLDSGLGQVQADSNDRFSWQSIIALIVGTFAFALINVALLALVFHVMSGHPAAQFVRDGWRLSASMAVGGVGVGATAVYLHDNDAWALLPFVALPALALWFAYEASAQHAEATERNRWLVTLGGQLARHGRGSAVLAESAEAIRQIVGAPEAMVLDPADPATSADERAARVLSSTWSHAGPRPMAADELPDGWRTGVVTRLDLGSANPGALLLGSTERYRPSRISGRTRGWSVKEADPAVLGALVAAVGSALRAGTAFDALTEETAKLTAVVDHASDGIAVIDEAGGVRLWSRTMATMTGVPAHALTDDPAAAPAVVRTLVDAALAASPGAAPVHLHLVRDAGEELEVSLATVQVREATTATGGPGSWVRILTVHDETRERRVERMKTDFIATISHELRTPITPIKGYAALLASRGDQLSPERRAQALEVISHRADHLTRLVDELLLASQVSDSARLAIEMGEADVTELVTEAVAGFPELSTRIVLTLPEEPLRVQCDRFRAVQCLTNLLGNAKKYATGDGPIELTVREAGRRVAIVVRDHGPGIPISEQERVFERFYRREDPFTMHTGGAGLGLHIARELATAMGGGLSLSTPPGGTGAQFVLELPRVAPPGPGAGPQPAGGQVDTAAAAPGQPPEPSGNGTMVSSDGRVSAP